MENYQQLLHHVEEEDRRRHANKHPDEEHVFSVPDSIRQKKGMQVEMSPFTEGKNKTTITKYTWGEIISYLSKL